MKVKIITDRDGPNPDFDNKKPEGPGNLHNRLVAAGTEIEHPDAWILCVINAVGNAIADPVDDEAKAKVAEHLSKRFGTPAASLEELRQQDAAAFQASEEARLVKGAKEADAVELAITATL